MKRYFLFPVAAVVTLSLAACSGSGGGSSAAPPTNVAVATKDSRVVVTWDMLPGVQYWIWKAAAPNVTPQTCSSLPACTTLINVSSPATISGLANGTLYSFSINSRINGGPGGDGSPAVSATPRLAGATWNAGTASTGNSLRGVTYGAQFVAVGDAGTSFSSADGKAWTPLTVPVTLNLNAVSYDATHAKYLSVGANGVVMALTPATSPTIWAPLASQTTSTLYALANNGAGFTVATGAGGTVQYSADGSTWNLVTALTTQPLYGVTYGYDSTNARNVFVAVGGAGTVLYSVDGVNWTSATPATSADLKSVTYGAAAGVFLAVGANGTVLTSPDGINWALKTSTGIPATSVLNSVTFSVARRFVAVANDGNIFYSEFSSAGSLWTQVSPQATFSPLYGVTAGPLFDYSAVGSAGMNLYAD